MRKIYLQRISKGIVFADVRNTNQLKSRIARTIFVVIANGAWFKYDKNGNLRPINLMSFAKEKGFNTFNQYLRKVEHTSAKKINQTIFNRRANKTRSYKNLSPLERALAYNRKMVEQDQKFRASIVEPPF